MTKQNQDGVTEEYHCGNCQEVRHLEHHGIDNPLCPICQVERLTKMGPCKCPNCNSDTFSIMQPAQGESLTGADPAVMCNSCGRIGHTDDSGVWW